MKVNNEKRCFGAALTESHKQVTYKQEKFISYSSGGWGVPDQVVSSFDV